MKQTQINSFPTNSPELEYREDPQPKRIMEPDSNDEAQLLAIIANLLRLQAATNLSVKQIYLGQIALILSNSSNEVRDSLKGILRGTESPISRSNSSISFLSLQEIEKSLAQASPGTREMMDAIIDSSPAIGFKPLNVSPAVENVEKEPTSNEVTTQEATTFTTKKEADNFSTPRLSPVAIDNLPIPPQPQAQKPHEKNIIQPNKLAKFTNFFKTIFNNKFKKILIGFISGFVAVITAALSVIFRDKATDLYSSASSKLAELAMGFSNSTNFLMHTKEASLNSFSIMVNATKNAIENISVQTLTDATSKAFEALPEGRNAKLAIVGATALAAIAVPPLIMKIYKKKPQLSR